MSFELLKPELKNALKEMNLLVPTLPQEKAIPLILKGKDVLLCAPTGYGKTLSVVLPVINKLEPGTGIKALYITPLRALNRNIYQRIVELGAKAGIRVEVRHGDTKQSTRRKQALNPPHMLITTPETIQAVLTGKRMRENLKDLSCIIIDEIHELANDKRGAQLSIAIERLKELVKKRMQLIGLSATVSNKKEVAQFLSKNCEIINVKGSKQYDIKLFKPEVTKADVELSKNIYAKPVVAHNLRLISGAINKDKTLVFVNTRETAESLGSRFKMLKQEVGIHHSSLSKNSRVEAEDNFKNNKLRTLIATSSLELGIDIGSINQVIQYNSPRQVNKLVQRVGRAGHSSERVSKGVVISTNYLDYLESKAIIDQLNKGWIEEPSIHYKPLDVLAHQIIGFCFDEYKPRAEQVYKVIRRAYPYRNLSYKEFIEVIELMKKLKMIYANDDGTINKSRKGMMHYYNNLSMIPDEKSYSVIDSDTNKRVSVLHEGFIAKNCSPGSVFICRAVPWEVLSIEDDKVFVCRSEDYNSAIPSWEGELIPIHHKVASKVKELSNGRASLEQANEKIVLTTYAGSKINQTIAEIIAYIASIQIGKTVGIKSDAYRVVFSFKNAEDAEVIEQVLSEIKPNWVLPLLYTAVKNTNAFVYRFMQVAKRFGIMSKKANYSRFKLLKLLEEYDGSVATRETFKEMLTEKLDYEGAEKIINSINNVELEQASKQTIEALDNFFNDFSSPKRTKEIMGLVKDRLMNKKYLFYCLNCKTFLGRLAVKYSDLKCKCKSRLITFFSDYEEWLINAYKKFARGEPMTKEEEKFFKEVRTRADMYLSYGKMACYTLAARGVGTTTGLRVLAGFYKTEEDFIKKLIDSERRFVRTKRFWMKKRR